MLSDSVIRNIAEDKLQGSGLYITDLFIKPGNNIIIFIDGLQAVTIEDCIALSRHLEANLNRDAEDFTLQVSSPGLDQPLKDYRQFIKNVNRKLSLEMKDGSKLTGKLLAADQERIQLTPEITKGRKLIQLETIEIQYADIDKAFCLVSFK